MQDAPTEETSMEVQNASNGADGAPDESTEQKERRASIKAILADESLTPLERRRSIQSLMDGRRRSSVGRSSVTSVTSRASVERGGNRASGAGASMTMAAAAAAVAAAFDYDSDSGGEDDGGGSCGSDAGLSGGGGGSGSRRPSIVDRRSSFRSRSSFASVRRSSSASVRRSSSNAIGAIGAMIGRRHSRSTSISSANSAQHSIVTDDPDPDPECEDEDEELELNEPDPDDIIAHQHSLAVSAAMAYYENCIERSLELSQQMEISRPECQHYERRCTLVSPCCGMAFGCRICHDDSSVLPPPIFDMQKQIKQDDERVGADGAGRENGGELHSSFEFGQDQNSNQHPRSYSVPNVAVPEVPEHHNIDRFAVKEVICRQCYTRQSAKTNNCINCGVTFGEYHCSTCNLWMSDEEKPYHCAECGFCRVGGQDNFRHCFDCGMCIDAYLFDDHNCKVGKYMSNCPVCQEDLFSSRSASHEMPCGHAIHWHCFRELTSFDSRCPVCKKTAESHERMAPTWSAMAMGIALQPVPPELARVVTIVCTDCEEREENRRWHFLGVQCRSCTSFNTVVEETTMTGPEAHAFLAERDGGTTAVAAAAAAAAGTTVDGAVLPSNMDIYNNTDLGAAGRGSQS